MLQSIVVSTKICHSSEESDLGILLQLLAECGPLKDFRRNPPLHPNDIQQVVGTPIDPTKIHSGWLSQNKIKTLARIDHLATSYR